MIKSINSFNDGRESKWIGAGILVAILFAAAGIFLIILSHKIGIIIGAAGMVIPPAFCSIKAGKAKDERDSMYKKYLSEIPLETLIKASSSPEVDLDSSRTIVSYLNENHPGWSFN